MREEPNLPILVIPVNERIVLDRCQLLFQQHLHPTQSDEARGFTITVIVSLLTTREERLIGDFPRMR